MGRARTAVGRTNAGSRSGENAEETGRAAPQLKTPPPAKSTIPLVDTPKFEKTESFTPNSRRMTPTPRFKGYDPPISHEPMRHRTPTPDFDEPERVLESNLTALKRCRHKLNVRMGGSKKYFLDFNTKKTGNLSREEMYGGFNDLHLDFTPAQNDFLVRAFDADASNSVEYHEFCQTMEMSDEDILRTVGALSVLKPAPWIRPKGWKFTPHEKEKITNLQVRMQNALHRNFGANPRDIREAFLELDKSRSGFLSRDDVVMTCKNLGVEAKPEDLELLMAAIDNEDQNQKIIYTAFVKHFEPQSVGCYNPFAPTVKIPGTEHVTQEQLQSTGCPPAVKKRWDDSYGRDTRSRVLFPEIFRTKIHPSHAAAVCPPDHSDHPDFKMIDAWRHAGKTIGKEIMTLKSNKPIPPADSAQYILRATRMGFGSGASPVEGTERLGQTQEALPRDAGSKWVPKDVRTRDTAVQSPFGTRTKEDLLRDREARFRDRQLTLRRALNNSI